MKQLFIIILIFLFTLNSFGQIEKEVNSILLKKDFIEFKSYCDKLLDRTNKNWNNNIKANWVYLRDLTNDFQEGIIDINKTVPSKINKNTGREYTYRVTLITQDKQIIYYKLAEKKNKRLKRKWVEYYQPIDSYTNDSLFKDLKNKFSQTFGISLNEKELFIDSIVYGLECGFVRQDSKEKLEIDKYIKDNDKISLLKWLQSTNTEKQVYAIYGFCKLKQLYNVIPTNKEMELINAVMHKKGTILFCDGCDFGSEDISVIIAELKL